MSRVRLTLALGVVLGVMTGCASRPLSIDLTQLMPDSAAMAIVIEYTGRAWANQPQFYGAPICMGSKGPGKITDINEVFYFNDHNGRGLAVFKPREGFCGAYHVLFKNLSKEQAVELAQALAALGAKIHEVGNVGD